MRRKNSKKRSGDGKSASSVKLIEKIVLFALLLLSESEAQVPIDGFCRYREYQAKPNLSKIIPVDFNSDGFRDILILNTGENKYFTLLSDQRSNLGAPSQKYSGIALSDLHPFGIDKNVKRFLICSRKNRQAGIVSFSKSGAYSVLSRIKLNGYPTSVDVNDSNGDGYPDGLISGPSLEGLHLLKKVNHVLKEKKIAPRRVFSASKFIDLDYDGFPDIAAVDPLANAIRFYYNNRAGQFAELRSIEMHGEITEFVTADFNSDGFTDLVYIRDNHIEAMLGDSVSSFRRTVILDTPVKPDKFAILDFNGDGYNDIAFINSQSGELYIAFAKNGREFYPPILYMKKAGLTDMSAYIDRAGKKLALLGRDGKIYLISSFRINEDSFSIALGPEPSSIALFDYLNDRYGDICFIDKGEWTLKLVLSERRNLFRTYYSIPISPEATEIKVDDSAERVKTFFLYRKEDRFIEIIRVNFEKFGYQKIDYYFNGPIADIQLTSDRGKEGINLFALIRNDKVLSLQSFELRNFRLTQVASDPVVSDYKKPLLSVDQYRDIYFFTSNSDSIELLKASFDKKVIDRSKLLTYKINGEPGAEYAAVGADEYINRGKPLAAVISQGKRSALYYFNKNQNLRFGIKSALASSPDISYLYDAIDNALHVFFFNNSGKLTDLNLSLARKSLEENVLVESQKINGYLIKKIYGRKTFFIYSDKHTNTINFGKF
jgi:FG-GAP-like repeat